MDSHGHAGHICAPGCRDLVVKGYGHIIDTRPYVTGTVQLRLLGLPPSGAGVSNPRHTGCMQPTMAMNVAQHKTVNLLKILLDFFCDYMSQCI